MNNIERAKKAVDIIEEICNGDVIDRGPRATEIVSEVASKSGLLQADLANIFKLLTGRTVIDYIKERQMMHAYQVLIAQKEFNVEAAIIVSGMDNQQSFGKKFKAMFGITPKEAFTNKSTELLVPPVSWELKIGGGETVIEEESVQDTTTDIMYGIEKTKYIKILRAFELKALFGFNEIQSQVAFEVSGQLNISLDEAYEYISEFGDIEIEGMDESFDSWQESRKNGNLADYKKQILLENALDEELVFVRFRCGLSVEFAYRVIFAIKSQSYDSDEDITKLRPSLIVCFAANMDVELDFNFCREAVDAFFDALDSNQYGVELEDVELNALLTFVGLVAGGQPVQLALNYIFEEILIQNSFNDSSTVWEAMVTSQEESSFEYQLQTKLDEDWAEEQTDWSNGADGTIDYSDDLEGYIWGDYEHDEEEIYGITYDEYDVDDYSTDDYVF